MCVRVHVRVCVFVCVQDGNTFCTSLTPRLFSIDLSIPEHKVFFNEVGWEWGKAPAVLVYICMLTLSLPFCGSRSKLMRN